MSVRAFGRLAQLYEIGSRMRVDGDRGRAVELSAEFIEDLLSGPGRDTEGDAAEGPADGQTDETSRARAHASEIPSVRP
jgi:hypothetical protein